MATTMSGPRVLPGPRRQRVLGSWRYLRSFDHDALGYLEVLFESYGPVLELAEGPQPIVLALGAAANAELVARPDVFGPANRPLAPPGSYSGVLQQIAASQLVPAEMALATRWRAGDGFAAYLHLVARCTEATVARWGIGRQVDAAFVMRLLVMRSLLTALTGIDSFADPLANRALQRWAVDLHYGMHPLLQRVPSMAVRERRRALDRCANELGAHLAAALDADDGEKSSATSRALLGLIDKTAAVVGSVATWSVLLMSQYPRILSDVVAQVAAANGTASRDALPLLHRVVLETLRLFPPHALALRETTRRTALLGYVVPAGALLVASPYLTHRLADIFVGPKRFRPERWLYITPGPAQFLPLAFETDLLFSLDETVDQVRLILAVMLRQHYLALAVGARVDRSLRPTLLPRSELPMIVAPLDRRVLHRDVRGNVRDMVLF